MQIAYALMDASTVNMGSWNFCSVCCNTTNNKNTNNRNNNNCHPLFHCCRLFTKISVDGLSLQWIYRTTVFGIVQLFCDIYVEFFLHFKNHLSSTRCVLYFATVMSIRLCVVIRFRLCVCVCVFVCLRLWHRCTNSVYNWVFACLLAVHTIGIVNELKRWSMYVLFIFPIISTIFVFFFLTSPYCKITKWNSHFSVCTIWHVRDRHRSIHIIQMRKTQ